MTVATDYAGDYVNATYGDDAGLRAAFQRVVALPPQRSDNVGRVVRIRAFAEAHFGRQQQIRLLDVGAGLGVFPYAVKQAGWQCTGIDPDPRATAHMRDEIGVNAVCADFMSVDGLGQFDIVTFNKVLEHVDDPVAMLRRAKRFVAPGGFVYVELPDGEVAATAGAGREEFFVEHHHVFSFVSIAMLADRAGFRPIMVERLQEPSTKFTLRAFVVPAQAGLS
jgi:SAM-dependent methyltransferase